MINNQHVLSINLATIFSLHTEEMNLDRLLEIDKLQAVIDNVIGDQVFWDAAVPKEVGEFFVHGSAYSALPVQNLVVSVGVGNTFKEVMVFGDRTWKESGMSEPIRFKTIPINFNNAFGGSDYKLNPLGKGHLAVTGTNLPNIELLDNYIASINDTPHPICFEPYPPSWPQRNFELNDPKDPIILETDNIPKYFNAAPNDQFISGYYNGDETIEIKNMHPFIHTIKSTLPGLRLRLFVLQMNVNGENTFRELSVITDTLWLLPNLEYGVIMYKSTLPVANMDATDVSSIYTALELLTDPPKPFEYYSNQFQQIISGYAKTIDKPEESSMHDLYSHKDIEDSKLSVDNDTLEENGITEFFKLTSREANLDSIGLNDSAKNLINQLSSALKQFQINEETAKNMIRDRKEKGLPPSLSEDEVVNNLKEYLEDNPDMEGKVRKSIRDLHELKVQMLRNIKKSHGK